MSTDEVPKSLRPVNWDGSFSRTWNARMSEQWASQRAAEQEREWGRQQLSEYWQETEKRLHSEAQEESARRREEGHAASDDVRAERGTAAEELYRKLDKLDRFSPPEADGSTGASESTERGGSAGPE
ncbi:hypothetical protein [Frankia sp. ACN1ag]|uniref:hypothetical protein n=1 Tax=Frankia sp. ACN1ag TaxID=102891 RepID=UPI0006DC4B30|nr:hypothetical protein [Frankia sp. ACN1ag]KQC38159.1 hypothetical protein UK82_10745 [Frankia sp. ACN1ag]